MIPIEKNPTVDNAKLKTEIEIVRIAPRNQGVDIEFKCDRILPSYVRLIICDLETGNIIREVENLGESFGEDRIFTVDKLLNGVDYTAEVVACDYDNNELCRSGKRLFQTGFFPGHVINYLHPEDLTYSYSGRFLDSPNILRLENGTYIASHGVMGTVGHNALCLFYVSKDYGKTWNYISRIERCMLANLFRHGDKIYITGVTDRQSGDLVIYSSDNDCVSWSEPTVLVKHQKDFTLLNSPTAYAEFNGRLWIYFYNRCYSDKAGFQAAVASVPIDSDYMNVKNWTFTPFLKFDSDWEGIEHDAWGPFMFEEGNIIVNRNNELVMLIRYNSHRYDIPEADPTNVKALMLKIDAENPAAPLKFMKAIPFNSPFSKFYIRYDEKSDLYYVMLWFYLQIFLQ